MQSKPNQYYNLLICLIMYIMSNHKNKAIKLRCTASASRASPRYSAGMLGLKINGWVVVSSGINMNKRKAATKYSFY